MQASLAIIGGVLAIIAYFTLSDWRWLLAAVLILANWPYTLICIKPTNDTLKRHPGPDGRRPRRVDWSNGGARCTPAAACWGQRPRWFASGH